MIRVSKLERDALDKVGLIQYRKVRNGHIINDSTLKVCNREHVGKNCKTYYVVASFEVLAFLGRMEGLNLQRISPYQLNTLEKAGYVNDKNKQTWGTYVPEALVFQDMTGQWWVRKIASMLIETGIWTANKNKRSTFKSGEGRSNEEVLVGSFGQSMEDIALKDE